MKHIKKINEGHETRVVLTEKDFTTLVSGGIIDKDGVKIILQDIGYDTILGIIMELDGKSSLYDPHRP